MKRFSLSIVSCLVLAACAAPPPPVPADWAPMVPANSALAVEDYRATYTRRVQDELAAEQRKLAEAQEQARIKALQDYVNHRREVEQRNTPRGKPVRGSAPAKAPAPIDLSKIEGGVQ